jgi:putative hydrolase of the HAD superfamily
LNYIFDIGNVLINFRPKEYLPRLFPDPKTQEAVYQTIFASREWIELDMGNITPEAALEIFCAQEPNYAEPIRLMMSRLTDLLTPIPETVALLPEIKAAGHGLYYLSNYPAALRDYTVRENPFFEWFDGGVFSCDVHIVKPSPEIYRCLLKKYHLSPASCLFIDDLAENVKTAEAEGMRGMVFTGASQLKCWDMFNF